MYDSSLRLELSVNPRRLIACTAYSPYCYIIISISCQRSSIVCSRCYSYRVRCIHWSSRYHYVPRCFGSTGCPSYIGTRRTYIACSNIFYVAASKRVYHTESVVFYRTAILRVTRIRIAISTHYPHTIFTVYHRGRYCESSSISMRTVSYSFFKINSFACIVEVVIFVPIDIYT